MAGLIQCSPDIDFVFTVRAGGEEFCADTREMREVLDGVSFAEPAVAQWLREFIGENTQPILQRSNII